MSGADGLTLKKLMQARDILDAASVPVPDMYFDRRTGEWFRREGSEWVLMPALDVNAYSQGD
jgi:hypothetical protein